jgi:hypothetical protein
MMAGSEQRRGKRIYHEAPIMVEDFHTGYHYFATMHNYSDKGMYFEAVYAQRPGRKIRIENLPFITASTVRLAIIIWRRIIDEGYSFHLYGIGVKYC